MNADIKAKLILLGVKQWQVAEEIGISPGTLCVWLRYELTDERKNRIATAIDKVVKRGAANGVTVRP